MSARLPLRRPAADEWVRGHSAVLRIGAETRLIAVLARYISPLMARAIVDRALGDCGLERARLLSVDVPRVVEKARVGIGIFCEPENLTALMLDLADLCDAESMR